VRRRGKALFAANVTTWRLGEKLHIRIRSAGGGPLLQYPTSSAKASFRRSLAASAKASSSSLRALSTLLPRKHECHVSRLRTLATEPQEPRKTTRFQASNSTRALVMPPPPPPTASANVLQNPAQGNLHVSLPTMCACTSLSAHLPSTPLWESRVIVAESRSKREASPSPSFALA
jgi:hypothetical protein